jgi:hypothetical protein
VGSPAEEAAFQARLDAILFRHATPRRGGPAYLRPLIQALRDAPSWARGRVWRCALGECRAWFLDTSRAGRKEFCGRSHAVRAWKLTTRTTPSWLR